MSFPGAPFSPRGNEVRPPFKRFRSLDEILRGGGVGRNAGGTGLRQGGGRDFELNYRKKGGGREKKKEMVFVQKGKNGPGAKAEKEDWEGGGGARCERHPGRSMKKNH